ncbi:MAG: caspase family protein, partial [Hyphomicrobiaceae bacterium]
VIKQTDADMATMRQAFIEFSRRLKRPDSVGVFYYAGHAVQVAGQNYLIPIGADISSESEIPVQAVNLQELLGAMKGAAARVKIAILDSCRNNPFESSARGLSRGLAPVTAPAGTLIAYATAPGEVALDGTDGHSPFTSALTRIMPTPGLEIEEVFKRTRAAVLESTNSKQTPWEHSSLVGQFIFKAKGAAPEASAAPNARGTDTEDARRLAEIADWERIKVSGDAASFRRHLKAYPGGAYEEVAHYKITQLEQRAGGWSWWQTGSSNGGATRGDIDGAFERAVKLEVSGNDPQSMVEAERLYRQAAEQGVVTAMFNLGRMYDKGRGVARSANEAALWYGRAALGDHAAAQAALGTMYELGDGVATNLAEALRLYRVSAEKGDPHGMTSLGYLFAQGKGVARDYTEARRWYQAAAEKGQPRAMFNLALLQMRGDGGQIDGVNAIRWLNAAVEKGHSGAMRELAYMHDEGRFVERDASRAAEYMVAALEALKVEATVSGQSAPAKATADAMIRKDYWSYGTRRAIQKRLIAAGRYKGRATGLFDGGTRRALEALATAQ